MYLLYAIYAVKVCLCVNKGPLESSNLNLHLIHCSMDPHESDHKTASRSISTGLAQPTLCRRFYSIFPHNASGVLSALTLHHVLLTLENTFSNSAICIRYDAVRR